MLLTVFLPSRRPGQRKARLYRGRYRLEGMAKPVEVPLHTNDKPTAWAKLNKHVIDIQRAAAGLAPTAPMRKAMDSTFSAIVADYALDLIAQGRNRQHVKDTTRRVLRIARECRWLRIVDANPAAFTTWRAKIAPTLSAKMLKEYGVSLRAFFAWLVETERFDRNPFLKVKHPATRGRETRVRRAFTLDEARRLLEVADYHRLPYLILFYTGLRYRAAWGLRWCDYLTDAEGGGPRFVLPASKDKSRRERVIPVRPELAREIAIHGIDCHKAKDTARICAGIFPRQRTDKKRPNGLRNDLAKAGIPVRDAQGRVLDYHSFRKTFSTWAQQSGVPQAVTQNLLGHTTAEMTARHYTDAEAMGAAGHVSSLPWVASPFRSAPSQNDREGSVAGRAAAISAVVEVIERTCLADGGRHRTRKSGAVYLMRVRRVLSGAWKTIAPRGATLVFQAARKGLRGRRG
jgi:integrase